MKPRVFVSSTFYDLKFIREDISNFIKAHDFEPIMFEDGDIGYMPGKELDLSCYDAMKNADMVLLIIGGEYGTAATGEKEDGFSEYISITRKEFREAAKLGIPLYVFIDSNVYTEYGVYEANINSIEKKGVRIEFKATKNINVFRFIKEVRAISDKPIQEFRRAVDIKTFLSKQWSDMFKNYLTILRTNKENELLQNTVADMESLIRQMRIMLDAVGEKVIGDEDQNQYIHIKREQNRVEAERISQIIADGINVYVNDLDDRRANVNAILDAIKRTYATIPSIKSNEEHEEYEKGEMFMSVFLESLAKKDIRLARISISFVEAITDIVKALESSEIEKHVVSKLMLTKNYRRIFNVDVDQRFKVGVGSVL